MTILPLLSRELCSMAPDLRPKIVQEVGTMDGGTTGARTHRRRRRRGEGTRDTGRGTQDSWAMGRGTRDAGHGTQGSSPKKKKCAQPEAVLMPIIIIKTNQPTNLSLPNV